MKRRLRRHRLRSSPLVHVLAQVRFPPVLPIGEHIPRIKDRLTGLGFPRFQESLLHQWLIGAEEEPRREHVSRWDFHDRLRQTGVVLTRDFVLVQTTLYSNFEQFSARVAAVVGVIQEEVRPSLVERVGLRYVNLIRPRAGQGAEEYLWSGLVGYPLAHVSELNVSAAFSRMETVMDLNGSRLVVRCFQQNDGSLVPPDLAPTDLDYAVSVKPGELVTLLDLDHFSTAPLDFDSKEVIDALARLHDATDAAFRGAVTMYALDQWGQEFL